MLGPRVPEAVASPLAWRFVPLFCVGVVEEEDAAGGFIEVAGEDPVLPLVPCADAFDLAWTPNLGEEVGVDSDPDPEPRFMSDAGVTGARADFGVSTAAEVTLDDEDAGA